MVLPPITRNKLRNCGKDFLVENGTKRRENDIFDHSKVPQTYVRHKNTHQAMLSLNSQIDRPKSAKKNPLFPSGESYIGFSFKKLIRNF